MPFQKKPVFKLKPFYCLFISALTTIPVVSTANPANPAILFRQLPNTLYNPQLIVNGQAGSYRLGQLDFIYPLHGRENSLFFLDARYNRTNWMNAEELNLGLAYRRLIRCNKNIVGGYIWLDHSNTERDNHFNQLTVGGEFLDRIYDVRANIYLPFGNTSQFLNTTTTPRIRGNTVGIYRRNYSEQAWAGADVEVGRQVPWVYNLRAFADFYHFGYQGGSFCGCRNMNGGRGRLEYYYTPHITFTASYSYDNIRQGVGLVGIRIRFGGIEQPASDPMKGRMEDYIIRDNDIVTVRSLTSSRIINDSRTYWFVNNAAPAGGNGTYENPFNTEQQALSASGNGDVIYTFQGRGNYPLTVSGLNLKPNQLFTGSGGDLIFKNVVIIPATSDPILNGRINVANGTTLSNFTLSGQGTQENIGIQGNNVSNVTLTNLTVRNFTGTSANGAEASGGGTQTGSNGGTGADVYGIRILNSRNILLNDVTVTNIVGGSANGGNGTGQGGSSVSSNGTGGTGGYGGEARGIDLSNSSVTLNNVIISGILGGSANGGDGFSSGGDNSYNEAHGGRGGSGGNAVGLRLSNATAILNHVSISGVQGGSANGGDAATTSGAFTPSGNFSYGETAGTGGQVFGIYAPNSNAILSNVTVSNIIGGSQIGGSGSAIGATVTGGTNIAQGNYAGFSGDAVGINLAGSNTTLSNIIISEIHGGVGLGGSAASANADSLNGSRAGFGNVGGDATALDLTNATVNLMNISITSVLGGGANGGIANSSNPNSYSIGGNGHFGGDAVGIIETGANIVTSSQISINNVSGGSAQAGTGSTANGNPGTPGTSTAIQP